MSASSRVGATALMSLFFVAIVILGVASPAATAAAVTTAQQPGVEADADAQFADSAVQQPDIDTTDLNGSGTPSDPYEISNVSELQAMEDDLGANYELVSDIDASQTAQFNDGAGFDPVGGPGFDENTPPSFTGTFDGNNNTITGLTVNRPDEEYVGLFGSISGTVTNVTLTGVTVTGNSDVGGLVGSNSGTITDSSASGSVTATGEGAAGGLVGDNSNFATIQNTSASGSVSGSNQVGGLVGTNRGTIQTTRASGDVSGDSDVGGVAGSNDGLITDATVSGSVTGTNFVGGLIGSNRNGGTITNSTASGSVTGTNFVGGLVGSNVETITNSTASGSVSGKSVVGGLVGNNVETITNSTATGSVTATGRLSTRMGGLVGDNTGNITDATASGSVTGTRDVGGLVGNNSGSIQTTRASGSVTATGEFGAAGGLVGSNSGTITDAFAVGPVTGDRNGGLVGTNFDDSGTTQQSYFDINTTLRRTSAGNAIGLTTAQMQGQPAESNMSGFDFENTWTTTSEYPALRALSGADEGSGSGGGDPIQVDVDPSDLPGDGSESNPYQISNVSELQAMEDDLDANYELVSDIDASQTAQFNDGAGFDPVGADPFVENNTFDSAFAGSLDGNNNTITGLTITRPNESAVGLIGFSFGTVRHITLTTATITGNNTVGGVVGEHRGTLTDVTISGSVTGDRNVGGLVGDNFDGTIRNASASGSVTGDRNVGGIIGSHSEFSEATLADSSASGSVTGDRSVGGVVGTNSANITNVTASGSVTATGTDEPGRSQAGGLVGTNFDGTIRNASASGSVNGTSTLGGVVGSNEGNIIDSSASGSVNGTGSVGGVVGENFANITNSSASGSVNGTGSVGGVVGENFANITNSSASGSVNGTGSVGGVVGSNEGNFANITNSSASGNVTGDRNVGGAVGRNFANITNSSASGSVNGTDNVGGVVGTNFDGTIQNARASGNVTGDRNVGGLVGKNNNRGTTPNATIQNARASGNVTGDRNVGGLVGFNEEDGTVQSASASGSVNGTGNVGGLVGRNSGEIRDTFAVGSVSATGRFGPAGGLVGDNDGGTIRNASASGSVNGTGNVGGLVGRNSGEIRDTFAVGSVSATGGFGPAGGLVGDNDSGTTNQSYFDKQATNQSESAGSATGLTTAQMQGQAAESNMSGFEFGVDWQTQTDPADYPVLIALQQGTEPEQQQPTTFEISALDPQDATVNVSEAFDVSATVENTGDLQGEQQKEIELRLEPDGDAVRTQTVSLDAGNSTPVTFENVTVDTAGEFNHTVASANDSATGSLTVEQREQEQEPSVSVTFTDQTVPNGTEEVTVDSANFTQADGSPGDYVVVVHTIDEFGAPVGNVSSPIGASGDLTGAEENITVDLTAADGPIDSITENVTLRAMLHTTANDSAFGTRLGNAIDDIEPGDETDDANITVEKAQAEPSVSVNFPDQTVPNGTEEVTVDSANFTRADDSAGDYVVVVHVVSDEFDGGLDDSISAPVGASGNLSNGAENITVDLNSSAAFEDGDALDSITDNVTLRAMLHTTANDSAFGTRLGTAIDGIEPGDETDDANITVEDEQTVTVGGQEVPTEFTSETNNGDRTVTADNAVEAINTFIAGEISADVAVDVINAFIAS